MKNKKISSIKKLMAILPHSHNILVQAALRLDEIRDIFRVLNAREDEIEHLAEDYVSRLYLLKINK